MIVSQMDPTESKPGEPPVLSVSKLTKAYPTAQGDEPLTVLKDVSFDLAQREACAIVGPSGSGKTTLLGLCAGLDVPTSGSVILHGQRLNDLDEDRRAEIRNQSIGFVFQNFQLMETLTALENVMVPLELRGAGSVRDHAIDLLSRVGLKERVHHFPAQLSGGEQQRVALARAFINRPKILFADEPTGNLDGETSHRIVDILFELNHSLGTSLVLVTHDSELASRTRQVIRLKDGQMLRPE
jgi:putative ABC transport system ATP-binding protein